MNFVGEKVFNELFASDRSAVKKVGGGAAAGLILGGYPATHMAMAEGGVPGLRLIVEMAGICLGTGIMGAIAALALVFMDVTAHRARAGQRVNPILYAYFGQRRRWAIFLLWLVTIFVVVFAGCFMAAVYWSEIAVPSHPGQL